MPAAARQARRLPDVHGRGVRGRKRRVPVRTHGDREPAAERR
jgi:hypothetical protein